MRVPLGVVAIIYEARPNVTADAAGLCLKSGNAAILRGGSEAIHSNQAIAACVHEGLRDAGLPETAVQVIETTDRAAVGELITMKDYVDIIVPRGGKGLIERISTSRAFRCSSTSMACAMSISTTAPISTRRSASPTTPRRSGYGTCNTMETLLVHKDIARAVCCRRWRDLSGQGHRVARRCPGARRVGPRWPRR